MSAIWFVTVPAIICALLLLHALPLLPTRPRLFGVSVAPEIRNGPESTRLLRRYQLYLLPFTAAAALIVIFFPLRVPWIVAAIAAASFASLGLVIRYHAVALRFALPPPSIREASLTSDTGGLTRRLAWFAPPFALLIGTATYLAANWNRIPETFAIHFGAYGRPDGWSHRTVHGVFGVLVFGAYFLVALSSLYAIMDLGSRRFSARSAMLTALAAPSYLIAILFSLAALFPLLHPPAWLFLLLAGGFLPVFVTLLSRVLARRSDGPREVTPDQCWHGQFYYNPDDPALFVEARIGFGYTVNFARRPAWLLIALTLAFVLGAFLLAPRLVG
jgi:uncharacterized membrane protein